MKIQKIVGFGDSWMFGDELLDPALAQQDHEAHCCWIQNIEYRETHCFLGLLGAHYGLPTENFGIPGGSLRSTIWTYLWWIQNEPEPANCLVLLFLTEPDRQSFYNPNHVHYSNDPPWNKFVHSTWVQHGSSVIGPEFTDMIKRHIVLTHDKEHSILNYLEAMMFFDGQACRQGFHLLQYHGAPRITDFSVPTLKHPEFDWITHFRDRTDNQKRELLMAGGHPNEKGHAIISDLLKSDLDRVILNG
jgi:hypothetical protein